MLKDKTTGAKSGCLGGNSVCSHPGLFPGFSYHQHHPRGITDRGRDFPPAPQSHREDQILTHWQAEKAAAASEAARAGAGFPESHGRGHHPHTRLTPPTQAAAQLRPGVQSSYSGPDRAPGREHTCGNYQKKSLRPVAETPTQPPSSQESVSGPGAERPKRT